jgi:hypothetical protein
LSISTVALSGSAKELPEIENTQAQAINRDCMVFILLRLLLFDVRITRRSG